MWAFGVTVYEILEGCSPWPVRDEKELKQAIRGGLCFNHLRHPELQAIVAGCVSLDA
jgi:hypothetical protein